LPSLHYRCPSCEPATGDDWLTRKKYGVETVENVVTRITPTVSSSRIAQSLDSFANKQLDKVEKAFPSVFTPSGSQSEFADDYLPEEYHMDEGQLVRLPQQLGEYEQAPLVQTRQKSSWETVVSTIGTYVVSAETMQRLRYCLEWLQVCFSSAELWLIRCSMQLRTLTSKSPS